MTRPPDLLPGTPAVETRECNRMSNAIGFVMKLE
jgi:hypothetical protein